MQTVLSPDGKKIRSKPQLAREVGDMIDLSAFDFRTGRMLSGVLRKSKRLKGTQFDYARGVRNDASLVPPIRQTASIFKQPVTVVKTQNSRVKSELKHGPQDKPKQVFWEKRLQGLHASDINGNALESLNLPHNFKSVGPHVESDTLLQSIATSLHTSGQPITGQTGSKSSLDKNPGVYLNPDQPLMQALMVSEEDIKRQETKVLEARKRLEKALQVFAEA
ncbi:PREDICTED: methyl-CpG-binding domain protein 2-like isoform X2 [Priapulus caudatus]|uniref:Methyl-CpG-binding domain protein 2-like isoform X2 n=1 Tax=Priapulus caudatus TaxID=37621 RepID=A0ABM1EY16_PRICU|nr:PREDICTED: methyl-CpG-binding domain protein 2-like isoform X2 [Priapulus caudatus]XP_014677087.1 PREDICTED: methyl-CpG-binding domain protein 2-like isoform X2 [Priapulus caudatus]